MPLDYEQLAELTSDPSVAAIRSIVRLQPAAGPGAKVMPPTYMGQQYAKEYRVIDGNHVPCVTVDSVQSQAGRMEDALRFALDEGRLSLPVIQAEFPEGLVPAYADVITTLDAPHRIADAIFRESYLEGRPFRDSEVGQAWTNATERNATGLFRTCPQALIYGLWDSTGAGGGRGTKFRRLFTSDITAVNALEGVRTSSRVDPTGIEKVEGVYRTDGGDWTLDPEAAAKNSRGEPVTARPSEFNLGNITPDFVRRKDSEGRVMQGADPIHGGITCDYLLQTPVVSLAALRRLQFPTEGAETERTNPAARTLLAAVALAALSLQREGGFSLRSGCDLVAESEPFEGEIVYSDGRTESVGMPTNGILKTLDRAVEKARDAGLSWETEPVRLTPSDKLIELLRRSRTTA